MVETPPKRLFAENRAQARAGLWPVPAQFPQLRPTHIHVWCARLTPTEAALSLSESILSGPERDRANRFHFIHHRERFILGRGILRMLLAKYTGMAAAELRFVEGPFGKPALEQAAENSEVFFNISHCEDVALFAFRTDQPIGVDIERVRELKDADELVARFFSARENQEFQGLSGELKAQAFFNLWTRKEALLKATGDGIAQKLHQVEVALMPGEPAQILGLPVGMVRPSEWFIQEFCPVTDFCGAVVTTQPVRKVITYDWPGFTQYRQL
jgi:4'-phosphopantetheinyl transferase